MLDWEMALESLRGQGCNYAYGKCYDPETTREIYIVNLRRGDERLSISNTSIKEAVFAIFNLAEKIS
jgi:hypothetical protein